LIVVGAYSFPGDFECHCCDKFVSCDQGTVLTHLASEDHHQAHLTFVAAQGPLNQEETLFLEAMDLYSKPSISKMARLMAKATKAPQTTQNTAAPRVDGAQGMQGAKPESKPTEREAATGSKPAPPTPISPAGVTPRITRTASGSALRKPYGDGPAGDAALAQDLDERERNGLSSPVKEKAKPPTPASARTPLRVLLPFYDYVCDVNLTTEREARDHFETETHQNCVGAFLARNRAQLEAKDPEALAQLNSTLPAFRDIPWAQRLAAAEREEAHKGTRTAHEGALTPSAMAEPDSEDFGRRLIRLGKPRETAANVYEIGPEESLRWDGRYDAVPTPARCTICDKALPNSWQVKEHCESRSHQGKCMKLGEAIVAKALDRSRTERLEALAAREAKDSSKRPSGLTHGHPASVGRPKATPPLADFPCAGAKCGGRVSVPLGDPRAAGKCSKCGFSQVVPTNYKTKP